MAQALLEQPEPNVRASGVGMLLMVVTPVTQTLKDSTLAMAVVDAWLYPHLVDANVVPYEHPSRLHVAIGIYDLVVATKDQERTAVAAALWIREAQTVGHHNKADAGRIRLAKALEAQGRIAETIRMLEEVTHPSLIGAREVIPRLRAQLDQQSAPPPQK